MFKVKEIKTGKIFQVLDVYCDDYSKSWFLLWIDDGWRWRAADEFVPPNYIIKRKVIVAGSRSFTNYRKVQEELDFYLSEIGEVVCGSAQGADELGRTWAIKNNIPVKMFPADWQNDGQAAGFMRNHKMGDYADALIAFWDGQSAGTKDMIDYMNQLKKPVHIIRVD